jgi:hypothetical protein
VPEVTHSREDHGDACFICRIDDFLIAHRTTGLNNRGSAGFDGG